MFNRNTIYLVIKSQIGILIGFYVETNPGQMANKRNLGRM